MCVVLREMGALLRAVPPASAAPADIAAWYERKAVLFDCIAAEPGVTTAEAARAAIEARAARAHSRRLLHNVVAEES